MSEPNSSSTEGSPQHQKSAIAARSDLMASLGWSAMGAAILIGSIRMDRLEEQDVNPYTIPGLLPGLLGIAMIILAALLAIRSIRQGALSGQPAGAPREALVSRHLLLVLGLCLTFGVGLVGRGLPFWLAAGAFVTVAILSLQRPQRKAAGQRLSVRQLVQALVIGFAAGGAITLVFQEIFLVRLP